MEKNHMGWENRPDAAAACRDAFNDFFVAVTEFTDDATKAKIYDRVKPKPMQMTDDELAIRYGGIITQIEMLGGNADEFKKRLADVKARLAEAQRQQEERDRLKAEAALKEEGGEANAEEAKTEVE